MPKRDDDLFDRLRRAGVRKQVAKTLSELSADAGKKATSAGHRAVAELRTLADEIEKRLPPAAESLPAKASTTATLTPTRRRSTSASAPKAAVKAPVARPRATAARTSSPPTSLASRGENKQKILAALQTGPHTASEVSKATGIATATVSTALTRLTKTGEVTKAARGYALPAGS